MDATEQLAATQAAIADILERHHKAYNSVHDEVYTTNPVCEECRLAYPCDVRQTLSAEPLNALHQREQKAARQAFTEAAEIVAERGRDEHEASRYANDDERGAHAGVVLACAVLTDVLGARADAAVSR
jgi:hypothetical protein